MLFLPDHGRRVPLLAAHYTEFRSVRSLWRWRRAARLAMPAARGLVFGKAMVFIGSRRHAGFGAGVPGLRTQILLTAWQREADFLTFLAQPLARSLASEARCSGWALFEVASVRGSHYGATPLSATQVTGEHFAAMTLGRTRPRALVRFLREGARLGPFVRNAPGLVAACSAGFPLTGNCTLSVWETEADMMRFAYHDADGHPATLRRRPPILTEQLNARMRLRRIGGTSAPGLPGSERLMQLAGPLA